MHLLACMLARIWSAQEATAIWAEIIDTRRQKIKDNAPENSQPFMMSNGPLLALVHGFKSPIAALTGCSKSKLN
jgi:hypothetical protein